MDHDLRWIREQLAGFGERDAGFRYPEEFRRRVARYAERRLGQTTTTGISREVGIPWVTIRRWQGRLKSTAERRRPEATSRPMVPVHVTEATGQGSLDKTKAIRVTTPQGWKIEGLSVDEVCRVVERLS